MVDVNPTPSNQNISIQTYVTQSELTAALATKEPLKGANDNYVTDAEKIVIQNTSGTNTGDQDLSGLVTKTTTVNGKALSENIIVGCYVLTSGDIASNSPADNTTYYIGGALNGISTVAARGKTYIPKAGIITGINVSIAALSAVASSETSSMYIRVNNTTDYLISNQITVNNTAGYNYFSNYAFNISVSQGDYYQIKWVTPTWATNPTGVRFGFETLIEL